MKNAYSREEVVSFVKALDVRARKFTDAEIDNVINRGYAELSTVTKQAFSSEEVVDLEDLYEGSELKHTFDVEDDVTEIYDIYVTQEGDDKSMSQEVVQDVGIYRNSDLAFRDNRYVGRVHVDLDAVDTVFDNLVVKYFYTPRATTEIVYMDSQTYLAWQDAMGAATSYFLKDVDEETRKRTSMNRTSKSMVQQDPEDSVDSVRAVFS